jgi:hypothetical protein
MASAAQKISMGVNATPALTRNQDRVASVGRLFTSCALQSNQTTGYQVTVSSASRTPILRWPTFNRVRISAMTADVRGMGAEVASP